MISYSFERTSTKGLYRVVDSRTKNWDWYFLGKLNRQKLPKTEEGVYLRAESAITRNGWPMGKWFEGWLREKSKEESERIFTEAMDRGSRVHRAIETLFEIMPKSGGYSGFNVSKARKSVLNRSTEVWDEKKAELVPLQEEDWRCILSFEHFWSLHKPFVFAVGSSLYSVANGYAGTTDITGWILTKECGIKQCPCKGVIGKVGLPDLKTTTAIRDTHGMQVAAFAGAENVDQFLKGKKLEYTADLRLGTQHVNTRGYEFVVYDREDTAKNFESFLLANEVDKRIRKEFEPEKEIREIPDSVQIQIRPVPKQKVPIAKKVAKKAKKKAKR